MTNNIELDKRLVEEFSQEDHPLLNEFKELAEINLDFVGSDNPRFPDLLKFSGGMRPQTRSCPAHDDKTAERAKTFLGKSSRVLSKTREAELMEISLKIGRRAVMNLKLKNIHPEIQRMVGFFKLAY